MKNKKAFTLIELLIVMTLLGALAFVSITSYTQSLKISRNSKRKQDLKIIEKTLAVYYADNHATYPISAGWNGLCSNPSYNPGGNTYQDYDVDATHPGYIAGLAPKYIPRLPHDPMENQAVNSSAQNSCYLYNSNGKDYKVIAYTTVERTYPIPTPLVDPNDPFYDPYPRTSSYAVYTSGARLW